MEGVIHSVLDYPGTLWIFYSPSAPAIFFQVRAFGPGHCRMGWPPSAGLLGPRLPRLFLKAALQQQVFQEVHQVVRLYPYFASLAGPSGLALLGTPLQPAHLAVLLPLAGNFAQHCIHTEPLRKGVVAADTRHVTAVAGSLQPVALSGLDRVLGGRLRYL